MLGYAADSIAYATYVMAAVPGICVVEGESWQAISIAEINCRVMHYNLSLGTPIAVMHDPK